MKPEKGLTDMDDKVYDPRVLFAEVGLLITEARTPELSKKGRIEGPHCPPIAGLKEHECDRHKEQCRKASNITQQQEILWQNKIPMRIDVLLFPDCKHGQFESTVVEGASLPAEENFELLERWDVQLVKKRSPEKMEGFIKGRSHLQAVRSYLHFSQLSSWLISMGGAIPLKTVYRIYAPGESVGPSFSRLPEVHNFPSADLGDFIMRTTCAFLPRQKNPMVLFCRSPSPAFEPCRRTKKLPEEDSMAGTRLKSAFREPVASTSKHADEMDRTVRVQRNSNRSSGNQSERHNEMDCQVVGKPPFGPRSKVEGHLKGKSEHSMTCPVSITPKRKVDQLSPTMQDSSRCTHVGQRLDLDTSDVAIATKTSVIQASTSSTMDTDSLNQPGSNHPGQSTPTKSTQLKKPDKLCVTVGNSFPASKRLPSPKVLVTGSKKPEPTTFKKRCLDLQKPECISENDKEFESFSQMDELTATNICDLIKPPSLGELEAYLSSLSNKAPRKQRIEDIPTTKCNFYMEDSKLDNDVDEIEVTSTKSENYLTNNAKQCAKNSSSSVLCQARSLSDLKDYRTPNLQHELYDEKHLKNYRTPNQQCEISDENHVKALFVDSVTLYEDLDNELNYHTKKSQSVKLKSVKTFKEKRFETHTSPKETSTDQLLEGNSKNCEINCELTEDSERHVPEHDHINCAEKTNGSFRYETHSLLCLSKEVKERISKKEKTLNELSIPCNIGAVDNAMTTLAHNLESMDIDDRPYSPFSINGSPTLDNEVERHLSSKSGAVRPSELCKCPDLSPGSSSLTPSPDSCDSNSPTARGLSLCKQLLKKEFQQNVQKEMTCSTQSMYKSLPSPDDIKNFQFMMNRSASVIFNSNTGLPSRSSPAPIKKKSSNKFDYDCSLTNVKAIKNAFSCSKLTLQSEESSDTIEDPKIISTSAPASTNCLLGNFEESVLNGRIEPVGVVDGFSVEIGAGGTFCPKHVSLPVAAYFFQLSDDNAPSPYLGHVNLEPLGKRGYHIPRTGTVQITLFNPNKTVVKMFVVMYDLSDMPANCQTFLRQRTLYMPVDPHSQEPSFLRYLIHLRFQSSKSGKVYLHTDIRLIFARDKFEFDPRVANYELRSFTEGPENPKFSPKKL